MDTDRLFENSAKFHNVCDQRHQKPPRAKFHCNQMETDKIDNLLIHIDQPIIDSGWTPQNSKTASSKTVVV